MADKCQDSSSSSSSGGLPPDARPGNFDKAWNDPPLLSYANKPPSGSAPPLATTTATGTKLTKRLGFSASDLARSQEAPDPVGRAGGQPLPLSAKNPLLPPPPPPPPTGTGPVSGSGPAVVCSGSPEASPEADPAEVAGIFREVLSRFEAAMEPKTAKEIERRIGIMEARRASGGLNPAVERGLSRLAACLLDAGNRLDEAEALHRALMVDWPAECGSWLVGIKHLVHEVRKALVGGVGGGTTTRLAEDQQPGHDGGAITSPLQEQNPTT